MSRRVEFRPAALRDLRRLAAFLARFSPRAAERRIALLHERISALGETPHLGRSVGQGVRQLTVIVMRAKYVIRYVVGSEAILVTRVWHGLEDRPR